MKQARAKSFIRAYEDAGLLPAGSHLVKGGGGSIPRQFTIWASEGGDGCVTDGLKALSIWC